MELLADHLACWGCHIAFPELSFLTLTQLRKFMKATPVERFRQASKGAARGELLQTPGGPCCCSIGLQPSAFCAAFLKTCV